MKGLTKLALDIGMGAVAPILILNNLTKPLGAPPAYVLAALVPVAYIIADTLFISQRFNVITTYVALSAIMNGILAFWFVDGVLYALKDTASLAVSVIVFIGSLMIGRPIVRYFVIQALSPDTPARDARLRRLLALSKVRRSLGLATLIIAAQTALAGAVNFALNLNMVTASFGSDLFNQQVAQVNAITRVAFPITSLAAFGLGFVFIFRALYSVLPQQEDKPQQEGDLWLLIDRWEPTT
ncbi:MAG: VC0807 family protein, partial [Anaerolineae bacterium]